MKKIVALILLLCTVTLMFSSCGSEKIEKPEDTNLEYWLLDKPNKKEWTQLTYLERATDQYLAQGYEAVVDENGDVRRPESCVVYYIQNYPLADFGIAKRISRIEITDPNVYIWGLTLNSDREEIEATLRNNGFIVTSSDHMGVTGDNGRYRVTVRFEDGIYIHYETPSIIAALWSIDFD